MDSFKSTATNAPTYGVSINGVTIELTTELCIVLLCAAVIAAAALYWILFRKPKP